MGRHGLVMALGAEAVALEPAARGQGWVRLAEGLGPWVPGSGRSVAPVWDPADQNLSQLIG